MIIAALVCSFSGWVLGGITYRVSLNADACHEVNLPRLTKPPGIGYVTKVETGYCRYEIRNANESLLYLTAACGGIGKDKFVPAKEKYSVNLGRKVVTRKIDESAWETAPELPRSGVETLAKVLLPRDEESGVRYNNHLLERSGPAWHGKGDDAKPTLLSWTNSRAAVNSWDGIDITYSFLDPGSTFKRNKENGSYWIDIYDTGSGERLIKIQGTFSGIGAVEILQAPAWYSDRYYVMPLGVGLKRLLICDVDTASRKDNSTLKERK